MIDVKKLQRRVGATIDGVLGPGTMMALFLRLGAKADIAGELGIAAPIHLAAAGVLDTERRFAHFLAQCGHESDGWNAMEEYASGQAYEGRKDLGNVQPGDGRRYKGRGPIQVTGRANYRIYGGLLGIDLERRPELASAPSIGLAVSCAYWRRVGINAPADADDVEAVTRQINGGLNGLADRQARLKVAKDLLA